MTRIRKKPASDPWPVHRSRPISPAAQTRIKREVVAALTVPILKQLYQPREPFGRLLGRLKAGALNNISFRWVGYNLMSPAGTFPCIVGLDHSSFCGCFSGQVLVNTRSLARSMSGGKHALEEAFFMLLLKQLRASVEN
ncbi:MAG: hypothetical protein KKB81_04335 [Candidatus Margulisbacteria bacterium]|nr:hypothetical protein [Candidatus Margulisiibacteriota bacterium]MBU1021974.1 hypothetical protein [Candidatus Margulisiibacteriota bacterium]MBU1728952.1 hypothetical protein [Candidatus Margulisiibacteriota bacterium]MBU1954758.1 hypothetical protein [Candidatus Margulisiibacteriota bacterium]